ncbi:MAG: hypothetical protein HFACDABA_02737 [Anaerolineales bacterium]|nr:hypothetical protein [Anaerolineales bacterium]
MVEQIIYLLLVFNFFVLIGLVAGIRYWQNKHGKLTEKRLALILTGYWSFFTITTFLPLYEINFQVALAVQTVLLLVFWIVGYPWFRWLYRYFNSSKR